MTEVKLYRGLKAELPSVITDGAIYVTTDTGEVFVDVSNTERIQLSSKYASGLRAADNSILEIANIFTDSDGEAITRKSYTTTLIVANWIAHTDGTFYQDYANTNLTCGKDGNIPPEITYTSNREEYSKLDADRTEATPCIGIRFWSAEQPTADIGLIIIDK